MSSLPIVVFACDDLFTLCYVRHLLIQSVCTQLRSIIVLYVMVLVELVGTVSYTRTSTLLDINIGFSFKKVYLNTVESMRLKYGKLLPTFAPGSSWFFSSFFYHLYKCKRQAAHAQAESLV